MVSNHSLCGLTLCEKEFAVGILGSFTIKYCIYCKTTNRTCINVKRYSLFLIVTDSVAVQFSPGILLMQISSVTCDGSELRLISCSHVDNIGSCTHSNDVGIHCGPGKL